jgi:hypothetical protein
MTVQTPYDGLIGALRKAARPQRTAPPEMAGYVDKVRLHAYKVVDRDVDELKTAFSEDEIFEHTVSAATEAGLLRLEAALRIVE